MIAETVKYEGKKRVLILGSSGQIGAHLTEYLKAKDYDVREFDAVNGEHQDMTEIPNIELHRNIMVADFIFFLAFDVGGSRYLKKYQKRNSKKNLKRKKRKMVDLQRIFL